MKKSAFWAIAVAGVLWGTSGIFVKLLTPYGFTSIQMTAIRATVSFVCMLGVALIQGGKPLKVEWRQIPFFVGAGVALFATAASL